MSKLHSVAFTIALGHFLLSAFLCFIVLFLTFGYGLSDQAVTPVWWFVVMNKVLLVSEAPVVLILWLLYHPAAHFHPPSLFAVDFAGCANVYAITGLCLLWSLAFGYLVAYALHRFRTQSPT